VRFTELDVLLTGLEVQSTEATSSLPGRRALLVSRKSQPTSMRYYLTRDGQTYGPYNAESIPGMVQAGNMVPEDLVCPEGGTEWVALKSVPGLLGAAAPVSSLRVSAPVASTPAQPAAYSLPVETEYKAPLSERVGDWWGTLKLIGYGVLALIVVVGLVMAGLAKGRDKREIAKLQSAPGWKSFAEGNGKIASEGVNAGFGNTGQAEQLSKSLAKALEAADKEMFVLDKSPRYRGRSKLGRIASAVDAATAGTGHFQTFIELRGDRAVVLVHVPEYDRYEKSARTAMRALCAKFAAAAVRGPAGAKPDFTLVVGVRGKEDYDCAYVGPMSAFTGGTLKASTLKNVPTHKLLVQWFGDTKPNL
jgi:hypothetical protein